MRNALAAAALASAIAVPHVAFAEDEYLDNRSNAGVLVQSLYNAVNRKEYARAWDYYGDQKPAASYQKFVDGYADTERVDVATGLVGEEGAAGSIFYSVPVAIRATDKNGGSKTFAGCYTARLVQPAVQEPPFRPMHIENGALKPASDDGPLAYAVPESCGDAPPVKAEDHIRDQIINAFKANYSDCESLAPDAEPGAADPEIHTLKYKASYDTPDEPEHEAKLFQFYCGSGAYNTNEVYYLAQNGGFTALQFAQPELRIDYEDPDEQTKLNSMTIIGYTTADRLVNSEFDENDKSLTSFSKWRGVGDASSVGKWIFRDGEFTLVHYEADPTYDSEINPETVLDFDTAP